MAAPKLFAQGWRGMGWCNYFFSISGRVSRARFWLFFAVSAALLLASAGALTGFDMTLYPHLVVPKNPDVRLVGLGFLLLPFYGAMAFGILTIPIKRLHDRGRSGWWLAFYGLVPVSLFLLAQDNMSRNGGDFTSTLVFELLGLAIWIMAIVELGVLRGTQGDNCYGDDPLSGLDD